MRVCVGDTDVQDIIPHPVIYLQCHYFWSVPNNSRLSDREHPKYNKATEFGSTCTHTYFSLQIVGLWSGFVNVLPSYHSRCALHLLCFSDPITWSHPRLFLQFYDSLVDYKVSYKCFYPYTIFCIFIRKVISFDLYSDERSASCLCFLMIKKLCGRKWQTPARNICSNEHLSTGEWGTSKWIRTLIIC